ncbi:peptidase E [Longirhabdus pacifica]|uniref:Type 1 glutamine amidotransferase-like domain-containing protein n=1 Tax=Longirhabdus pacifica TaxID=2305227 RepID=UPI001008D56A|nr:peptidase E [Longirhabdus pacifica]
MKQMIAMGGGGFSMEPDNLLLDQYILDQANTTKPKICFVPTASGDSEGYIERFYDAFTSLHCEPSHLSLFLPPTTDLEQYVMEKDIIYVGGGNTKNLLALWREWELDRILQKAWNHGIIMAGISAGANCWYEQCVTTSFGETAASIPALGFYKGSYCPHFDGEVQRRPNFHTLLQSNDIIPGYGVDDGVALHYKENELHHIVSSRPEAKAYFLHTDQEGTVKEEMLAVTYLGK